jgi:endonuclease/exonuclease/phosphatase family metal-dependent hydrolase
MATKLGDPNLEGDARPRGGLLEHQRDGALGEGVRAERGGLELRRSGDQRLELSAAELFARDEVAWQAGQCTLDWVELRVLTWNLKHGRAVPPAQRDLLDDFAAALAGWEWEVALLQEVPPWWSSALADRLGGNVRYRLVLTSRNALLPVRRAIAVRWPELIKSGGGGANAILVRGRNIALGHQLTERLALWPERRKLQAVRLVTFGEEVWMANLHATVHDDPRARGEAEAARVALVRWAAAAPFVLGGDFNVRGLALAGLRCVAAHDVDYVFASGFEVAGEAEVLEHGALSDHAPVAVTLVR